MKGFFGRLKKHWITVWLVTVLVIFSTFVTYAIYTEVSSIKRVVTTKAAPKELFSSNCMYVDRYERKLTSTEFNVNVNNFDMSSLETYNPTEIQYTLTAQLWVKYGGTVRPLRELATDPNCDTATYNALVAKAVGDPNDPNGNTGYWIGKSQDNNSSGIISNPTMTQFTPENGFEKIFKGPSGDPQVNYETLPGNVVSTDRFKVVIPESDLQKTYEEVEFFVYVKAHPEDTGLHDIDALLYGAKNVVVSASWSGTLVEQDTHDVDYDFYNYVISGSGSGKLDIMWDPTMFEIDDFFFGSLSGVTFDESCLDEHDKVQIGTVSGGTHNGWNKVTIVVDSSESKSRYELQLYKVMSDQSYTGDTYNAANFIACEMQQE